MSGELPYSDQPTHPDDGFQPLDPRSMTLERASACILLVVLLVLSLAMFVWFWWTQMDFASRVVGYCLATTACLGMTAYTIWWPGISFRSQRWRLSEIGLEIRRGVLWKHQISIPWARVQHSDVSQGPVQRMFQLGSLTVHTAGTKHASVTLEGLAHHQALSLRDEIIRQRKPGDVV